jgi:hypothetical protein
MLGTSKLEVAATKTKMTAKRAICSRSESISESLACDGSLRRGKQLAARNLGVGLSTPSSTGYVNFKFVDKIPELFVFSFAHCEDQFLHGFHVN